MELKKLIKLPFWLSLLSILMLVYEFGVKQTFQGNSFLYYLYTITLIGGVVNTILRYFIKSERPRLKAVSFDLLSILFIGLCVTIYLRGFHNPRLYDAIHYLVPIALFLVFFREFASLRINLTGTFLNPAQVFIISFLGIIILGASFLMLPTATYEGISVLDALFTSTSAVCVTGLIVVDTSSYFTPFGQFIILILIQIGGLGIMTFASYFSYFFRGGTSYENRLMLGNMTNSDKLGEVFTTLKKIILITFLIEGIGFLFLMILTESSDFDNIFEHGFFALFHSISSFCNAGFSTLENGMLENHLRFNYPFQLVILALFVIGGLGFPIVFNLFNYIKHQAINKWIPIISFSERKKIYTPWVVNLNSRIVLITSFGLMLFGAIVFYFFEYNHSLSDHSEVGKFVTALFSAATPRTAGFNTVDFSSLQFSTIMLIFLLMWVGASPASTGGGIKTNTFAIATLNFWSIARGKERVEVFRREISPLSIRRAFAIISLSLVVIGAGVFAISYFDSDKDLLSIAFECFSAYSTVGLTLGITSELSSASKFVIIIVMFIGRVSMLTILIAIMKKAKYKNYKYSTEEVLIN